MKLQYKTWLARKRKRKERIAWLAGYDWATGALLRKEETPLSLDAYTCGYPRTHFDHGVDAACAYLIKLGVIKDNLI